ncbi:MAG: complement resistance protein TraT [Rhodospirillales bacterium]
MTFNLTQTARGALVLMALVLLGACQTAPQGRMGMVTDPESGLMYGSVIQDNLVTDPTFYNNNAIKIRTRNTSGDTAFGLTAFTDDLQRIYADKGYAPQDDAGFGLMIDVNVMYSGHIQTNYANEFSFLGATAGGLTSLHRGGTQLDYATYSLAGAAVGAVLGANVTEDTYMIVSQVTFGVVKKVRKSKTRVTFSRSPKLKNIDDPDEDDEVYVGGFKKSYTTQLAVYAGGRNVTQAEIVEEVKRRMIRIVGDFL